MSKTNYPTRSQLKKYFGVNEVVFGNLLNSGMHEISLGISSMTLHINQSDYTKLAESAHRVKGAISYLRLPTLEKELKDLELSSRSIESNEKTINQMTKKSCRDLQQLLKYISELCQ